MAFQGTRYTLAYGLIAVVIVAAVVLVVVNSHGTTTGQPVTMATSTSQETSVMFACDESKTIQATFTNSTAGTSTAALTLSDGRTMTLAQTISADGGRYSNGNPTVSDSESFVFWNKGNTAFVEEGDLNAPSPNMTYKGCITVASDPGGLTQWYSSSANGFSLRYPDGYTVDSKYQYQEMGPGKSISGVKFTIPTTTASGTNLSSDTYISVETLPKATECSASAFLDNATASQMTDGDTTYSVASSTGAGAGNRYEEWVYAIPGTNPCIAVRYYIHYGNIDNYPAGSVQQFDEPGLIKQFDAIRRTLTIGQ